LAWPLAGSGSGIAWLTLILAFGIGISRIYLGAHYPLDVAAGMLVGAASGLIARLLVEGFHLIAFLSYAFLGYAGLALVPLGCGG
jgi:membrane-associated phospholipid phosphatase